MKISRDINGRDLADHLIRRWQFRELRQTGSHIILRTETPIPHTVSIPAHKPMRVGTLKDILEYIAEPKNVTVPDLLHKL